VPCQIVSGILRGLNLANAVLLGFACYYAFKITSGSVTRVFLATYIGVFALLLFLFETRVRYTSTLIRRMFGFMFTFSGRCVGASGTVVGRRRWRGTRGRRRWRGLMLVFLSLIPSCPQGHLPHLPGRHLLRHARHRRAEHRRLHLVRGDGGGVRYPWPHAGADSLGMRSRRAVGA
jgi:hypothetical protein